MRTEEKAAYWQQHFKDWRQSGLAQRDYCKQHQLAFSSFGYWRKRLKTSRPKSRKLISVAIGRPAMLNIYLPSGVRIEAPLHSLTELLPLLRDEASR